MEDKPYQSGDGFTQHVFDKMFDKAVAKQSVVEQKLWYGDFQAKIWGYYQRSGRHDLPWRQTQAINPYAIFVSEVMLQQTQVARVVGKYGEFLAALPDFAALADAPVAHVLALWQGLGYNRRALNLQRAAQQIVRDYGGELPREPTELIKLPGIGPGTAGSLAAFAYDSPVAFIETNIRRVFIHEFFGVHVAAGEQIGDDEILPLVEATLDRNRPRRWYWALMDYGAMLGTKLTAAKKPNPNRASRHYSRQSAFVGSHRQLRGELILWFLAHKSGDLAALKLDFEDPRLETALQELIHEGFIEQKARKYRLKS